MCGIAGIYSFKNQQIASAPLLSMASAIKHRGPDEEGISIRGINGFGHRRLKIIDLSPRAAQPMTDDSGRYTIIFNGEIYNFRDLRKELEREFKFFSQSDTEVILRLFQKHYLNSWQLLNGMFALAIYDSLECELFIARDHAGIKPLYYFHNDEFLVYGSELKAIFASTLVSSSVDPVSLSQYLKFGYCSGNRTIYRNIHKLPPGSFMRVNKNGIEIHRYWNVRDDFEASERQDPVIRLSELLKRAVENQMISDVPVGAFLSGGIDSSLIVALMTAVSEEPVKTFTVGFPSLGYYDERPYARKIAELFKTEHHEYSVDTDVRDIIERLAGVFDEPFADSSAIPTLCLAELTRSQVTVALSGTGGDEIFGGYRKYMAAHWSSIYHALPSSVRTHIRKAAALLPSSRRSLWQERALLLQRFTSMPHDERPEVRFNTLFSNAEIEELAGIKTESTQNFIGPDDRPAAEILMLFDFEYYLPDDLLVKEDRCTMAYGLEARVPYLDREVIQFMTAQPLNQKVNASSTKRLFRKVAARFIPREIVRRPKHGFGSPVAEWLKSSLRQMMTDLLSQNESMIRSELVENKLKEHLAGQADHSRQLWALMMLELWHRQEIKRNVL